MASTGGVLHLPDGVERSRSVRQVGRDPVQQQAGVGLLIVEEADAPPTQRVETGRQGPLLDPGQGHGHEHLDVHGPSVPRAVWRQGPPGP